MKKHFFTLTALMLSALFFSTATAQPRHSTEKELAYAMNEAVHSVIKSDYYFSPIENKNYPQIVNQIKICESELESIKLVRTMNLGYEGNTIVALAQIVIMNRNNCLHSVYRYIKAINEGNKADTEYYKNAATLEYADAEKYRKQFKEYTGR